jgi:hypothetical protein
MTWTESIDAVAALGELRSLVQAQRSIDAMVSVAVCSARDAGVPVALLATELGVNRATLYRKFGYHEAAAS